MLDYLAAFIALAAVGGIVAFLNYPKRPKPTPEKQAEIDEFIQRW
jgi:hypothetical protein